MNTQNKIFAKLSSLSKGRVERKENLGAIEDAIAEEIGNLESRAQKFIDDTDILYSAIENFFNMRDQIISDLSSNSNFDINAYYKLLEDIDEARKYSDAFSADTYLRLEDIESVIDASTIIQNGLEGIRTPGIG